MSIFSHHSRFSGKGFFAKKSRGFTVIELLVVLAIITILSAVFIFQQKRFDSSTLLRSLAYSIALTIRQAQVYGTSVRQFGTAANSFNYSYGVYFSSGDLKHYYLFADVNGDKQRASDGSEDVQTFTIGSGYTLMRFCATPSGAGAAQCSDSGTPISWMVIYFKRPNPDACFATSIDANTCNLNTSTYQDAYIQLQGPTGGAGDTRRITVTSTGQITVGSFGT
jgi:prepilin-type N-terminal cleavage/methylation domain-containing protein